MADANEQGLLDAIRNGVSQRIDTETALRNIFKEFYRVNAEEAKEKGEQNPGYLAWSMLGVDVAVRIAKAFMNVKANTGTYETLCDFTYQLATNEFWTKNASVLMPVIHVALNSHRDRQMLLLEQANKREYSDFDKLVGCSEALPLEIFPLIAYLIGGPPLMMTVSVPLKRALAPYFLTA